MRSNRDSKRNDSTQLLRSFSANVLLSRSLTSSLPLPPLPSPRSLPLPLCVNSIPSVRRTIAANSIAFKFSAVSVEYVWRSAAMCGRECHQPLRLCWACGGCRATTDTRLAGTHAHRDDLKPHRCCAAASPQRALLFRPMRGACDRCMLAYACAWARSRCRGPPSLRRMRCLRHREAHSAPPSAVPPVRRCAVPPVLRASAAPRGQERREEGGEQRGGRGSLAAVCVRLCRIHLMRSALVACTRTRLALRSAVTVTLRLPLPPLRPARAPSAAAPHARAHSHAASMSSATAAPPSSSSAHSGQVQPVAAGCPLPAPAPSSQSAAAASPSSSAAVVDYSDPEVRHLAVYGTLRDDDDSGAVWTASFLRGCTSARGGTVRGARMYWSAEGSWPFAMLHEQSSARSAEPPAAATAATCEHESDLLHVRLLTFESSSAAFAAKIAAADEIEGFSPDRPNSHEYVRRKIWVDVEPDAATVAAQSSSSAPSQPQRIPAWLYIKEHGLTSEVLAGHERIEHGDWMKRDRNRNK